MKFPAVEFISDNFIKPKYSLPKSNQAIYLGPFDLGMAFVQYMQKGFLFPKPPSFDQNQMHDFLLNLKESLSLTLVHFYPLAGRFEMVQLEGPNNPPNQAIYVDCNKGPGARFIHASAELNMVDIVSPIDVPSIVRSFFDHEGVINYDCGDQSLMTIQVTELIHGVFMGFSMNHMVADGTSLWHFLTSFAEIFNSNGNNNNNNTAISRSPTYDKVFPKGKGPLLSLPFADKNRGDEAEPKLVILRERIFHFSTESVAKLKAKANDNKNNGDCDSRKSSSFQAVSAHVWRCITRARKIPSDQTTIATLAVDHRSRLVPPASQNSFGNYVSPVEAAVNCGELLERSLGWAALLLHEAVNSQTDETARDFVETGWVAALSCVGRVLGSGILIGGSSRSNMSGFEFGFGKAIAIRSGSASLMGKSLCILALKEEAAWIWKSALRLM
ncbi:OLC1v1016176C1 [Oldenlandia corymbosa var. corymbosa]|uniref:OLC1v1016176C1 n=1 Tax=Oldenlandia corymbosa var. corymbosa TaxID=529605 RepID=A0AAV1E556_OLDCO|nr:OLC1v1016176C1 [Oldenlandia corymbosa var. corymbosa]